jgi:hypothetical protein
VYNPYVRLFGKHKGADNSTLDNGGDAPITFELSPGMRGNDTLLFNGSQYVTLNDTLMLGLATQIHPGAGYVQSGFSVVLSFITQSERTGTVWELATPPTRSIALKIEAPGFYVMRYARAAGETNAHWGPAVVVGRRTTLLVRCVPDMLLCTIIDLSY